MSKDFTMPIIAAVIGVAFIGIQTLQKEAASNTANLPATNANVAANSQAIIDLREQLTKAISSAQDNASNALQAEGQLIRSEINRREPEVIDFIKTLNEERKSDILDVRKILDRFQNDLREIRENEFEHVNTPKSSHSRPHNQ